MQKERPPNGRQTQMTDEQPSADLGGELSQKEINEAFSDYIPAYPPEQSDGECHRCGYEFDADEWETRHISAPGALGETWRYTCPECDEETIQVGT